MPILTSKTFTKSLVTQLHTLLFFIKKYKLQIPSLYYQIIGKKKKTFKTSKQRKCISIPLLLLNFKPFK